MLHEHKKSFVSSQDILKYLAKDKELSDELAELLEIEVDSGESAGGFLRDVCQMILDEGRRKYAMSILDQLSEQ